MTAPTYEYRAIVVKVIDGDTVDFDIILTDETVDLGFRLRRRIYEVIGIRSRLLRINAPERGQPGWAEANEYLREQLPVGYIVRVKTFKDPTDKYGRWLVEIYDPADGQNINDLMVTAGHAEIYT